MGIGEGQKTLSNGKVDMRGSFTNRCPLLYATNPTVEKNKRDNLARDITRIRIYELIDEGKSDQEIQLIIEERYRKQGIKDVVGAEELTLKLPWDSEQLLSQIEYYRGKPGLKKISLRSALEAIKTLGRKIEENENENER